MGYIKRFEDIRAWQTARELTKSIYEISNSGLFNKDFGLKDQIQRASVSIMANVAEGFDCDSNVEFARFLAYARRSAVEVQSLLYIALDVNYIDETIFQRHYQLADKAKGLIGALRKAVLKNNKAS